MKSWVKKDYCKARRTNEKNEKVSSNEKKEQKLIFRKTLKEVKMLQLKKYPIEKMVQKTSSFIVFVKTILSLSLSLACKLLYLTLYLVSYVNALEVTLYPLHTYHNVQRRGRGGGEGERGVLGLT